MDYTCTSLGQIDTITRVAGTELLVDYDYTGTFVTSRDYPTPDVEFQPQYDQFGRFTRMTTENTSGQGVDFGYIYDDNGNIESQTYHHRTGTPANGFNYDDLNRLTAAAYQAGAAGTEGFNYDLLGNRDGANGYTDTRPDPDTVCSYAHNLANEYTAVCGVTVLHDAAGNLTQDKSGYTYHYDYENRLVAIKKSNDTITVATFEYDALGRRIEKVDTIAGTTTRFYYDDQEKF